MNLLLNILCWIKHRIRPDDPMAVLEREVLFWNAKVDEAVAAKDYKKYPELKGRLLSLERDLECERERNLRV